MLALASVAGALAAPARADVLRVPEDHSTIQAALDAAASWDAVLVAPGTWRESLVLSGKTLTLASHFLVSGDPALIAATVIDGGGQSAVHVAADAGPATTLVGLTLRGGPGGDGISARGRFALLDSRVVGSRDGIDYESGSGGLVQRCLFQGNADDGIDLDGSVALRIEESVIAGNGNDGIEIRFHRHDAAPLEIAIVGNRIARNRGDGIQLIGGEGPTQRILRIEGNVIEANGMAGLGMTCCMQTREDFQGAPLPERVLLVGNTFLRNDHGASGGANLVALNNLFVGTQRIALKRAAGRSIAAHNLFFANGFDHFESYVDPRTTWLADPRLDTEGRPAPGSPALDAGAAVFDWRGERVLDLPPAAWRGSAPDLGAFEAGDP